MKLQAPLACGLALALGCADDLVVADQDDGDEIGAETGEPEPECEPDRVFADPVGLFVEPVVLAVPFTGRTGIAAGGDVVFAHHSKLRRVDRSGQLRWERSASDFTVYSHVGLTLAGEIIVIGRAQSDGPSLIERFDSDGLLLARATFDHHPNASESLTSAAVSPRGDVLAQHFLSDHPEGDALRYQLVYVDGELNERWVDAPIGRPYVGMGFDEVGNAYTAHLDYATVIDNPDSGPPVHSWPVELRARTPDGDQLWLDMIELIDTGVPRVEVAVGDQVYVRLYTVMDNVAEIRAYDLAGTLNWELVFDPETSPMGIAASPCGGLHVVGGVANPEGTLRSIWSLGPDGELGPITPLPEDDGIGAGSILVSPLDDVIVHGLAGNVVWVVSY